MALLNSHHRKLLGYICSLVGNRHDAEDVLQRTSVTMWRKFHTFECGSDFMAWASTVAFYEAKNFLRLAGHAQVPFDDALLEVLANERALDLVRQDARISALHGCLEKLDAGGRELVRAAYQDGTDLSAVAQRMGRATQTIYNRLHAIRKALVRCVQHRLAGGMV